MTMDGGATLGYWATGSCRMATAPSTAMNKAIEMFGKKADVIDGLTERRMLEEHGDLVDGTPLAAISSKLRAVIERMGLTSYGAAGDVFDPNLHEAVLREPSEEHVEDVVIAELQRGYHLNGRVLRHALVKVSMGPGPQGGAAEPQPSEHGA